ncbi:hypothetical protein M9Y10_025056 [Tritrichomonas musculus]|uniref:Uncharacterized protein n=1 Tax=Tritrichomonas musculus TaxID=1915356 RepID=A0ABR2HAD9_9EUKA
MFNSLNGPLGRPLEEKKKETSTDLSSPNDSGADNIPIRPRRSQTLPPALPGPIKKDDVALTIFEEFLLNSYLLVFHESVNVIQQ